MYICENYTDALKKLTDEDLKRVIEYFDIDEYKSRCNSYSNAFYLMNLREDTHSEFLAWLFDCREDEDDSIRQKFVEEFFVSIAEKIGKKFEISSINNVDTQVSSNEGSRPDIVIETDKEVIIIEVKLDAKTSLTKKSECGKIIRRTQYERYKNWAEKQYNGKEIKYILICSNENRLKTEKNFKIGEDEYKTLTGKEIIEKLKYKLIEFSDIILILYKIIEKANIKILQSNEVTKKYIEIFKNKLKNNTKNYDSNKIKIQNIYKVIKNGSVVNKKFLKQVEYKRPKNCNIHLKEILSNTPHENEEFINQLLVQYIDYWQYINPFNDGYTQIIEHKKQLFFINDICKQIKEENRKDYYDKLSDELKDKIKQIIKKPKSYKAPSK